MLRTILSILWLGFVVGTLVVVPVTLITGYIILHPPNYSTDTHKQS